MKKSVISAAGSSEMRGASRWLARLERRRRGDGIGARRHQTEPPRDAMYVRVDREVGTIEGKEEHAGRGLRSDAGERDELLPQLRIGRLGERPLVERDAFVADRAEHRADPDRLR